MGTLRIAMAIVWFAIAAAVFCVPTIAERFSIFAGWFALLLGVYNLIRWWCTPAPGLPPPAPHKRRRPHDPPPQPREYYYEFDFERPTSPNPPKPE